MTSIRSLGAQNIPQRSPEPISTNSRVPPELCDNIIDLLCEDRRSLYACSLTCRTWLPRTRYWLYKNVRINPKNKTKFQDVLSSNTHLGDFVEHMSISIWLPHHPFEWDKFLQSVTACMRHLTTLRIHSGYFKDPKSFQYLTAIRTLRLEDTYIDSETTRLAWLRSIPQIEELAFSGIRVTGHFPIAASDYPPLRKLNSIKIDGAFSSASAFLRYVSVNVTEHIKHLELGVVSPKVDLPGWFTGIAPVLEHLAFTSSSYYDHPSDLVLNCCTRLRSLAYTIYCHDNEKDTACLLWALQQITSPSMTVLRFNLFADDWHVYDRRLSISDFPALSTLLSSPKFASLERLSFHLSINFARRNRCEPPLFSDLRTLLADLNMRGILALSTEVRDEPGRCGNSPERALEIDEEVEPLTSTETWRLPTPPRLPPPTRSRSSPPTIVPELPITVIRLPRSPSSRSSRSSSPTIALE